MKRKQLCTWKVGGFAIIVMASKVTSNINQIVQCMLVLLILMMFILFLRYITSAAIYFNNQSCKYFLKFFFVSGLQFEICRIYYLKCILESLVGTKCLICSEASPALLLRLCFFFPLFSISNHCMAFCRILILRSQEYEDHPEGPSLKHQQRKF